MPGKPATLYTGPMKIGGAKRTHFCGPFAPRLIPPIPNNPLGMYGGDDGARTRDLCRDSNPPGCKTLAFFDSSVLLIELDRMPSGDPVHQIERF